MQPNAAVFTETSQLICSTNDWFLYEMKHWAEMGKCAKYCKVTKEFLCSPILCYCSLSILLKTSENLSFSMFSGGTERDQCHEMS